MIIERVLEGDSGDRPKESYSEDNISEYESANELFELIAKHNNFKPDDQESLTPEDLILIYKNIDLGTKLMSDAKGFKKSPNQYVESIIYKDDPESESDISQNNSDDTRNVISINKDSINLINNLSSLENSLCNKLRDLELCTTSLTSDYERQFVLKDPYLNELKRKYSSNETYYPTSFLDYLMCCKRLEDNHFYMDNVIQYVRQTIDHLKRISNGDYLTDKAKEKWREVKNDIYDDNGDLNDTKGNCCASSTSVCPLKPEVIGESSTWNKIVEIDVRFLSKMLDQKMEMLRLLQGSYGIFSTNYQNKKLVLGCEWGNEYIIKASKNKDCRITLDIQLKPSCLKLLMGSNISSKIILRASPGQRGLLTTDCVPLSCKDVAKSVAEKLKSEKSDFKRGKKIVELDAVKEDNQSVSDIDCANNNECERYDDNKLNSISTAVRCIDVVDEEPSLDLASILDNTTHLKEARSTTDSEESCNTTPSAEAKYISLSLNTFYSNNNKGEQTISPPKQIIDDILPTSPYNIDDNKDDQTIPLLKETVDANLPISQHHTYKTKLRRTKSPYQNKSFVIEEKKRKRFLEIKKRRESKKLASAYNKKSGFSTEFPHVSNSVSQIPITNKSFYSSIYGQTDYININTKQKMIKETISRIRQNNLKKTETDNIKIKNNNSLNKTLMEKPAGEMLVLMKRKDELTTELHTASSSSCLSNEFEEDTRLLSLPLTPLNDMNSDNSSKVSTLHRQGPSKLLHTRYQINVPPMNTPRSTYNTQNTLSRNEDEDSKKAKSAECRESIDKIYELMNKLGGVEDPKKLISLCDRINAFQGHTNASSAPTLNEMIYAPVTSKDLKLEVFNVDDKNTETYEEQGKQQMLPAMVSKVIISNKSLKNEAVKSKRERKKSTTIADNPLAAISKILHEFDNVQKHKYQSQEPKPVKKIDTAKKILKGDRQNKINEVTNEKNIAKSPKIRKTKTNEPLTVIVKERMDKDNKKHVVDIIDEIKESRGEAVRGPSKQSRLDALAQPKRTYIQASNPRFGSTTVPDRLRHRLKISPPPLEKENLKAKQMKTTGARNLSPPPAKLALISPTPPDKLTKRIISPMPLIPESTTEIRFHNIRDTNSPTNFERLSIPSPKSSTILSDSATRENILKLEDLNSFVPAPIDEENTKEIEEISESHICDNTSSIEDFSSFSSKLNTEIEKWENALCGRILHKRLKINSFTLTQKQSMQEVLLLQSGDNNSLSVSKNLKISSSKSDTASDLNFISYLMKPRIEWAFPMCIKTVGYGCHSHTESESRLEVLNESPANTVENCNEDRALEIKTRATKNESTSTSLISEEETTNVTNTHFKTTEEEKKKDEMLEASPSQLSAAICNANYKSNSKSCSKDQASLLDTVGYTTSLDMLVGLLNEIQTITTCQTKLTKCENNRSCDTELETLLNKSDIVKTESTDASIISVSSVEILNESDLNRSNQSYSYDEVNDNQISKNTVIENGIDDKLKTLNIPVYIHKEVDAKCEVVDEVTDVPSLFSLPAKNVFMESNQSRTKAVVNNFEQLIKFSNQQIAPENSKKTNIRKIPEKTMDSTVIFTNARKETPANIVINENVFEKDLQNTKDSHNFDTDTQIDPHLKIKRDILVTMYSILVLTVFVALTFPELMYQEP